MESFQLNVRVVRLGEGGCFVRGKRDEDGVDSGILRNPHLTAMKLRQIWGTQRMSQILMRERIQEAQSVFRLARNGPLPGRGYFGTLTLAHGSSSPGPHRFGVSS